MIITFMIKLVVDSGMRIVFLLFCMLYGTCVEAQVYRLERVTEVEDGGMYVFEQEGRVFGNSFAGRALQTTSDFKYGGLRGDESYVWTLESAKGGFYMKNLQIDANPVSYVYLQNSSSTDLTSSSKSDATVWAFGFQSDGTVLIYAPNNSGRFLGLADDNISYRAYAASNLGSYEHAIVVYRLVLGVLRGDVNTDGRVDISDVTSLIDAILNRVDDGGVELSQTDITGDGREDISDVTALIDIILDK